MVNEAVTTGFKIAPITGDIWDIYSGGRKLFDPELKWQQRALGAGQMGLGAAGLATIGAGSFAKSGIKGLAKYAGKYGAKKAMNKAAQKEAIKAGANPILTGVKASVSNMPYNSAAMANRLNTSIMRGAEGFNNSLIGRLGGFVNKHPLLSTAGLEGINLYLGGLGGKSEDNKAVDVTQGANDSGGTTSQGGQSGYYSGSGSNIISGGITPEQSKQIANMINTSSNTDGGSGYGDAGYYDPRALYQNYMIKQQAMQPYRDELNNYIRDYKRYSDWSYNQDKHLALLAALTGAQGLNQMIGKHTALGDEEKLAALKKVQGEDLKGIGEGLDELMGNVALARKMGLPLDAVNANDKMLQLAVQKDIKDDILENKLVLAQYNAMVRQKLKEEEFRYKKALQSNNHRAAKQSAMKISDYYKALQAMENYGATPEDIYRTTGRRIYVSNPPQSGQTFKNL